MTRRTFVSAVALTAAALTPNLARAHEKEESTIVFGVAEVKFRGSKDTQATSLKAEGGLDFNGRALDGGFTTSVFVKAPARESSGSYRTRLDEFSSGWRGGLTLAYQWTDQSTRDYTAHPCMVLLRRHASSADTRAELISQQDALAGVLAEHPPPAPPTPPGRLSEDARESLRGRGAVQREALSKPAPNPGPHVEAERAAHRTELGLVQLQLEHAKWAEEVSATQERAHDAAAAEFEASRKERAAELESEIAGLTRSLEADAAQIRDALHEIDTRGIQRAADGHCSELPKGWKVRLRGSGEFGGRTYAWRPLDAEDSLERARYSGAAQLSVDAVIMDRPNRNDREQTGWTFGPSFTVRYTQEWADDDEVGVLDASALDPVPSGEVRVDPRVVGAPHTDPTLSFRVFSYFAPPTPRRMFAFGPALAVTSVGEAQTREGVHAPVGDKLIARGEFWFYFMPTDAATVNTRLGIAPFFDATVSGRSDGEPLVETGALVSFQVGKPVYRY